MATSLSLSRIISLPAERERRLVLLRWALLGLLLRLLLMPFTMHTDWRFVGDMVAMNAEAHKIAYHGQLYPPGGYPPLAYYTMAFFLFLLKPLMPLYDVASPLGDGLGWVETPHVFRYLFLLKSWYLIFDFAAAFLLLRLINEEGARLSAFKFWMVNPFLLYTAYIHGEFDILPLFAVVLSLYCAKQGRFGWTAFWLGMGACCKKYPFFFLLPVIFLTSRSIRQGVKYLLVGTVPYGLLILPRFLQGGVSYVKGQVNYYGTYLFPAKLDVGFDQGIYLFLALYLFILWHSYGQAKGLGTRGNERDAVGDRRFALLWRYMLAILLLYYPLAIAAFHYYVWLLPMAVLLFAEDRRVILPYIVFLVGALGISISLARPLSWGLLAPLNPDFFLSLPSPAEFIEPYFPVIKVVNFSRTLLAGTAAWLAYWTIAPIRRGSAHLEGA